MNDDVAALLDALDALLTEGKRVPFGRDVRVDPERAGALLDELRATLPEHLAEARRVLDEREALLEEARAEAARLVAEARGDA